MSTENQEVDNITREYECAYLLVPSIADEKLGGEADSIRQTLEKHGAQVAGEKRPERTELAYTMTVAREGKRSNYNEGCFGWITFEAGSDAVGEMKTELSNNRSILRFMIIKADKDQEPEHDDEDVMDGTATEPEETASETADAGTGEGSVQSSEDDIDAGIDKLVEESEEKSA